MPVLKKINTDFFKTWSPDMAYVLGFFMADGAITVNPRGSEYISFHTCDKDLIEKIRASLKSEHKISYRKTTPDGLGVYRIQIGSKSMCEDLKQLGLGENKTHSMRVPDVPKRFFGDFVRGYFDGDGNVWTGMTNKKRKTSTMVIQSTFTSGSEGFLKALKGELRNYNIEGCMYCRETYFRLSYSILSSLKLAELMYGDVQNSLLLERKRVVFEKYKKKRLRS